MSKDTTLDEFAETDSDSSEPEAEDLVRKTVCGIPPQDWTVARLGELVHVVSGNSLPTEYQNGNESGHPVYKVSDMNATGNQKYVSDSSNRLSKENLEKINHTLYPEGTTILPKVGAALLTNKRRLLTEPSSFDNNVMGWVPDEINPEFLYYISCVIDMEAVAQKGAVPSISKAIAKSLKVPSPPLPEQRKIATVLYTVDQAIEKTEEIVEEYQTILSGLIEDIATTGIGNENLVEHKVPMLPERWEIPNHWRLEFLEDITTLITDGAHQTPTYVESGIPFLKVENIKQDRIDWGSVARIPEEEHEKLTNRSNPTEGDVLLSKNGTIGISKVVDWDNEFSHFVSLALIRPNKSTIHPDYLATLLESRICMRQANARSKTGTVTNLHLEEIKKLSIPVPPLSEQKEILKKVSVVEDGLHSESRYLNQLRRVKQGLMRDLLSGTVRTTNTNIEVPDKITQHG
ncbi:restriction endonuclease subunit S [Halorubrum sp. 2020YC2]|uniref:restriction endonuclease subunit S n=1 Tax=Halorubrum sp. 2020YC2 TaxID=2836432 RepID=UPI001BE57430|nr:restriction endonuclease subunit S [Halorubrum sp. 2020YC2]QWC18210.1 restriction endonuclease subunit S [Halorubrum sp. 2020YC2]